MRDQAPRLPATDDAPLHITHAGIVDQGLAGVVAADRHRGSARVPDAGMDRFEDLRRRQVLDREEDADRLAGRVRRLWAVPETIRNEDGPPVAVQPRTDRIARNRFAGEGHHHRAPGGPRRAPDRACPDPREQAGADRRPGDHVEIAAQASHGAEPGARTTGCGVTVAHRLAQVGDTRALVERDHLDADAGLIFVGVEQELASGAVFHQVRGKLGCDDPHASRSDLVEPEVAGDELGAPSRIGHLACLDEGQRDHRDTHRAMVTRVPEPGRESMENSFDRRRAPLRPRPRPPPVE